VVDATVKILSGVLAVISKETQPESSATGHTAKKELSGGKCRRLSALPLDGRDQRQHFQEPEVGQVGATY
jgi:hypothetical protein